LAAKRESDGENKLAALTQENNNLNQEIEAAEAEKTRLETVLLSVREQVVVL
jgi:predicted RNase H-like nuclease (RuvC/YqgF family)